MNAHRNPAPLAWTVAVCLLSFGCGSSSSQGGGSGGSSTTGGSSGTGGSSTTGGGSGSGGSSTTGGGSGGSSTTGGGTGGSSTTGGSTGGGPGVPIPDGGYGSSGDGGVCSSALSDRVRITEIDVGASYAYNEVDNNGAALGLTVLAISPIPGGGSRLAFLEKGASLIHIVTLDANDQVVAGSAFTLPGYDFQDIYADASGGTLLVSRNAMGSTAGNNCGNINNLCGLVANYPTAASCYDMYMVRFDGVSETWATKLTDTSATQPAYMTSTTQTGDITFVWSEYAHNGRIAFDGANYAGYYGIAISVSQACVGSSTLTTGINIHQGDQMKVVNSAGALQKTPGFGIGCSHSGYERVVYDTASKKFIPVCKNDAMTGTKSGRIALAPNTSTIYPVDLSYSDLGNVLSAGGGGDWIITSDIRTGQTANANGLADVHLLHIASTSALTPDKDLDAGERHQERPGAAPGGIRDGADARRLGRVDNHGRPSTERQESPDVPPGARQHDGRRAGRIIGHVGRAVDAVAQRARQPLPGLPHVPRRLRRLSRAREQRHQDQDPPRARLQRRQLRWEGRGRGPHPPLPNPPPTGSARRSLASPRRHAAPSVTPRA